MNESQYPVAVCLALMLVLLLPGCSCCLLKRDEPKLPDKSLFTERAVSGPSGHTYPMNVTNTTGQPILLLHEINGQTPGCLDLAVDLGRRGAQVYVPRLFGKYGDKRDLAGNVNILLDNVDRFAMRDGNDMGAIRGDLRSFLAEIRRDHPGEPITIIGNCLTGSLPFEVMEDRDVQTIVVCQPTLPVMWPCKTSARIFGIPQDVMESGFASMRKHTTKRIVSFNYNSDNLSISHAYAMADRLKGAGLAHRHTLHFGFRKDEAAQMKDMGSQYKAGGWKPLIVRDSKGHSTVTTSNPCDMPVFRRTLYQELGLRGDLR